MRKRPNSSASPLTGKQEAFCLEFMRNGGRASEAYRAVYNVGPTTADGTVYTNAANLLTDTKVARRIKELRDEAAKLALVEESTVLAEAARVGLSDIGQVLGEDDPISKLPANVRAAIRSVKIETRTEGRGEDKVLVTTREITLWDKNAALEKLFKHMGLYERDNKQRAGIFDKVPVAEMKAIQEQISAIRDRRAAVAREPVVGDAGPTLQ